MIITGVLISIASVVFIKYLLRLAYDRPKNFPPGPPSLPIWGSYWIILALGKWVSKSFETLGEFYNTNIVGLYLGKFVTICINDHETVREALTRTEFDGRLDLFIARFRSYYKKLGIFFIEGENWLVQRRFALRHMRDYGFGRRSDTLESVVRNEIKEMIEICLKPEYPIEKEISTGTLVRVPDIFVVPFMNPMLAVFMQETFRREEYDKLWRFARSAIVFQQSTDDTGRALCITPWLKDYIPEYCGYNNLLKTSNEFLRFYEALTDAHVKSYDENQNRHFIDQYVTAMNKELKSYGDTSFTKQQLVLMCIDFTLPASSATVAILAMLIDWILVKPEVQRKIHQEIDAVVGRDRLPTLDDRQNMHYTEACIREVMRMDSIVPLNIPHRVTQDTKLRGYDIPENTAVLFNITACHMNKDLWGDPENFRPERFLGDDGKLCLRKDKSLPFGAGKRLCAGETYSRQTMFQVFSGFMQTFHVSTADGKPQTRPRDRVPGLTTTMDPYWIRITSRNQIVTNKTRG